MLDVARNTGRNMGEEGGGRRPADVWMLLATSKLSVRNVVPTLTSSKRRGLSLNGRC
jgi:hypothetical protein